MKATLSQTLQFDFDVMFEQSKPITKHVKHKATIVYKTNIVIQPEP